MDTTTLFEGFQSHDWRSDEIDGTVRLAIVGVGKYAREYAIPAIERSDWCDLSVIVRGSAHEAEQTAATFSANMGITYDEFEDGVGTDAYDAVFISTPIGVHLDMAEIAADHGKHVLCEKPIEKNSERAARMVTVCADAGVTLMIAYRLQLDPTIRLTREIIDQGVIGEPMQIRAGLSVPVLIRDQTDHWRFDPDLAGGGALMDVGIYPINTSKFLLRQDPTAVFGTLASPAVGREGIEEHTAFMLEYPDGAIAACTGSYNTFNDNQMIVLGTAGKIEIHSAFEKEVERTLVVESQNRRVELSKARDILGSGQPSEIVAEFDYFAQSILKGETPEPDGHDGLDDVRTIEAIYESADEGCKITL